MKKILAFILLASIIGACNRSGQKKKEYSNIVASDSILLTSKIFQENCVVFLMPDSSKLLKMQKEEPEDNYNEIIADIQWYIGVASESLDSLKIKNSIESDCRLIFKLQSGKEYIFSSGNINGNMILFRNDTLPIISYAINFNRDSILNFFKR
jgi:hypothetical protein